MSSPFDSSADRTVPYQQLAPFGPPVPNEQQMAQMNYMPQSLMVPSSPAVYSMHYQQQQPASIVTTTTSPIAPAPGGYAPPASPVCVSPLSFNPQTQHAQLMSNAAIRLAEQQQAYLPPMQGYGHVAPLSSWDQLPLGAPGFTPFGYPVPPIINLSVAPPGMGVRPSPQTIDSANRFLDGRISTNVQLGISGNTPTPLDRPYLYDFNTPQQVQRRQRQSPSYQPLPPPSAEKRSNSHKSGSQFQRMSMQAEFWKDLGYDTDQYGHPLEIDVRSVIGRNQLYDVVKNQIGSRWLQDQLENVCSKEDRSEVSCHLILAFDDIIRDKFANYVVQKLLEIGDDEGVKGKLVGAMRKKCCGFSEEKYGCRVVQKMLESINPRLRASIVKNEFQGRIIRMAKHNCASHVIIKIVDLCEPRDFDFIIDELLGEGMAHRGEMRPHDSVVDVANNIYGCRLFQRLLGETLQSEMSNGEDNVFHSPTNNDNPDSFNTRTNLRQRIRLIRAIYAALPRLAENVHGNYIPQTVVRMQRFVTDKDEHAEIEKIYHFVAENAMYFAQLKYSSHLVEKCLINGTSKQKYRIVDALMRHPHPKSRQVHFNSEQHRPAYEEMLLLHKIGNYVFQRMLDAASVKQLKELIGAVVFHKKRLDKMSYGEKIISLVNQKLGEEESRGVPTYDTKGFRRAMCGLPKDSGGPEPKSEITPPRAPGSLGDVGSNGSPPYPFSSPGQDSGGFYTSFGSSPEQQAFRASQQGRSSLPTGAIGTGSLYSSPQMYNKRSANQSGGRTMSQQHSPRVFHSTNLTGTGNKSGSKAAHDDNNNF